MLKYIQAEIGKTLKRRYFWITFMIMLACAIGACIVIVQLNINGIDERTLAEIGETNITKLTVEHYMLFLSMLLPTVSYALIAFVDMITMEEYKNNTIKNIVSSGLSRVQIYMSKNIEIIILAFLTIIMLFGSSLGIAYIILGAKSSAALMSSLQLLLFKVGCSALLWLGALSMLHFFACWIKNGTAASLLYVALIVFLETIFGLLAELVNPIFEKFHSAWFMVQLSTISNLEQIDGTVFIQSLIMGLCYIIIFDVLGSILFKEGDL